MICDNLADFVVKAVSSGEGFGRSDIGGGRKVQVECVSADPNGPLTAVHGRSGVVGDVVANLLAAVGYDVSRESYVNDVISNSQMRDFGESVFACYKQIFMMDSPPPEDGYSGGFVADIAKGVADEFGDGLLALSEEERVPRFAILAEERMLALQKAELDRLGVSLDVWFLEQPLHENGEIARVVELLRERGFVYEESGALWFRSSELGDDVDRVLVRSNGQTSYIAADAAYHLNKFGRGFEKVVDVWGPDHYGYIARTKAVISALGYDADCLDVLVLGGVRFVSGGEVVTASKHGDGVFLLSDLLDKAGRDAARFFLLMRGVEEPLDFDLDIASLESAENPLFRVKNAFARLNDLIGDAPLADDVDFGDLTDESDVELMRMVASFPDLMAEAAKTYEPSLLVRFVVDLTGAVERFDGPLSDERLMVLYSARVVLGNALRILGIGA